MIDTRRALMTTNDLVSLRPFVVLAIRMMAPGRRRLEMVKLAHDLNNARSTVGHSQQSFQVVDGNPQAIPAHQRAA